MEIDFSPMRIFLFLIAAFIISPAIGQDSENIYWNRERDLHWEDFKAAPDHKNSYHAITSSGISFSWSIRISPGGEEEFRSVIQTYFNPMESWVKKAGKSAFLLAHEQLHFDISELHARKLKKAVEQYEVTPEIKRDMRKIFDSIQRERVKMQERFDVESRHGTDSIMEAKWQNQVRKQLEELKEYASG
ncbi:MAG TPA: DUF922 domain-containing protein [Salinimicrobium sp.]|nr:DUF922 domain-containing protein [Salinimicrobium sp.]